MPYALQQDLIDRFGEAELIQLTDRADPPAGAIDAAVSGKALADADDAINGYLASRYTVPLASPPLILTRLACDIARYYLYEDRVTEAVRKRYEDAVAYLKDAASGKVALGVDALGEAPADPGGPQVEAGDRTFSKGKASTGTEGTLDDFLGG